MINRLLTEQIRADVLTKGMDMVGFAPYSRWENAPFLLSPEAVLPGGKTVIVVGMHITDTWTDLGGEPEPQDLGPGGWLDQNSFLDRTSYRIVKLLKKNGYKAVGIASSNIWRYREFEGVPSLFAPDLSHIHAATAAGLAEIGWNGLAITPEFGPRVRFNSIVTDAELIPTPMYDGPPLCDLCMDCLKCCPTSAFTKETKTPHVVEIGGKTYKYANKNIWRCAWAEHFNLDLNSENLKNLETVGEAEIVKEIETMGTRGHERGVCQKVCIPPHLRGERIDYGKGKTRPTIKRINKRYPEDMPLRKVRDDILAKLVSLGAEIVGVKPIDPQAKVSKLIYSETPEAKTVIGFAFSVPKEANDADKLNSYQKPIYQYALNREIHDISLIVARIIEDYGYQASIQSGVLNFEQSKANRLCAMAGIGTVNDDGTVLTTVEYGRDIIAGAIVTNAPLDSTADVEVETANIVIETIKPDMLKAELNLLAKQNQVDLFGVADANVFDSIVKDLKQNISESELGYNILDNNFILENEVRYHAKWVSKIELEDIKIESPKEQLKGAQSVIVMAMSLPQELISNSGEDKTKQIGTYAYHTYQTVFELRFAAIALAKRLNKLGYKTLLTENMLGIGSKTDTPRGYLPDARCGSVEAVAAGLGEIGKNGSLLTPEFGAHQRQIVIITDAKLPADKIYDGEKICNDCLNCRTKCTMSAFEDKSFDIHISDKIIDYPVFGRNRCDWAKRYSLNKDEGPALIGNKTDIKIPNSFHITIEQLAEGCNGKDQIMKHRTCILEPCLKHCTAGIVK